MGNNEIILHKEIDLIQNCITRMAQNSFLIKGWSISITAVIIGLSPQKLEKCQTFIVLILLTLCFWYLDATYLRIEKMFRWKYEWIIQNRLISSDYCYDLNPKNENMWTLVSDDEKKRLCILYIMFNKTIYPIYLFIILLLFFIFIIYF